MSRMMMDATRQTDPDPLVLHMMDRKKAYPNCSRNAMDKSLEIVGVPPKMRNILAKLDSLTSYKCRSSVGLSRPYTTLRGAREGCPAAPIKFNVLHHIATMQLRKRWEDNGLGNTVTIDTFDEDTLWPTAEGKPRGKVSKLAPEVAKSQSNLDVVGYADDTTIVTRVSESEKRRRLTYDVYEEWGHAIHPDKWQRLWASKSALPLPRKVRKNQKTAPIPTDIVTEAKVLGCYLEADGGYNRERNHRMSKAGMV